jgi:NAD(P)-dependent dehydrogenase (short-subunit alcohol dehydrogenase family)
MRCPIDQGNVYPTSKRAVARWLRRSAVSDDWAGAGIPLNAVWAGFRTDSHDFASLGRGTGSRLRHNPMPLGGTADAEEMAPVIGWLLSAENTRVTELLLRGEDIWDGSN